MASDPKVPGTTVLSKTATLVKLFVASVFISSMQGALGAYSAIVNWTTRPNGDTVHAVLHQLAPALQLGAIRGSISGFIVVAVVLLGNPLWSILAPFLAATTAYIGNFVGSISRAVRSKKDDHDETKS
jgi:hypothetical protein